MPMSSHLGQQTQESMRQGCANTRSWILPTVSRCEGRPNPGQSSSGCVVHGLSDPAPGFAITQTRLVLLSRGLTRFKFHRRRSFCQSWYPGSIACAGFAPSHISAVLFWHRRSSISPPPRSSEALSSSLFVVGFRMRGSR